MINEAQGAAEVEQVANGNVCFFTEEDPNVKSREVRLGLVLYGGVSLAIYISGVTHEFFRAVRGRGVYRLIKALTDSDVIVDVISGTSAGGINGILLAYALCNAKDFAGTADLWREHGGIKNLLRSPGSDIAQYSSLLNSEGYYQPRLEEAFERMGASDDAPEEGEDNSAFDELDLFITGTDVNGNVYTQFDDAGHPIDVKDHRTVFLLKHRQGRKEPFNPKPSYEKAPDPATTHQALATLSRITSCFPAAFAPVGVTRQKPGDESVDAKLQLWGQLHKEAYFLDGGVLDNKPFTHTTKAIFSRSAARNVDRKLFFVEPDPECLKTSDKVTAPNFLQAILASLIGIPSYESIADDLKLLAEHNRKLEQYNRLVADLHSNGFNGTPTTETQQLYARSRLVFLTERVVQGIFKTNGRNDLVERKDRQRAIELMQFFDDWQLTPLTTDKLFTDLDVYYRLRRLFRVIYLIHKFLYGGQSTVESEQALRYRSLWGVLNQQIQLYDILRSAIEHVVDYAPIHWQDLSNEEIWLIVQVALYRLLDDEANPAQQIHQEDLDEFLRGKKPWLPPEVLKAVHKELERSTEQTIEDIRGKTLNDTSAVNAQTLLKKLDVYEQQILRHFIPDEHDPIRRAYDNFAALDTQLFPLEMVGGLHEKDIIETIRISPRDATKGFSKNSFSDKVSGDALYHFGGFFKKSWRSNDILWGRLDGLCQLVESLLTRDRLKQIAANDEWRRQVRSRFFEDDPQHPADTTFRKALDPADLFPNAGGNTHNKCGQWLKDLLSEDPSTRDKALDEQQFAGQLELIIEAAQLEVITKELPNVITDALEEQADWNQFQVEADAPSRKERSQGNTPVPSATAPQGADEKSEHVDPLLFTFQPPGGRLDPFVAIAAAAWMMKTGLDKFNTGGGSPGRPTETRLGSFFKQSYKVGREELSKDIPTPVLLEMLATALLVIRNCVLNLFGESVHRVKYHPVYIFGLSLPLQVFYWLAVFSRRAPRQLRTVFWVLTGFCLIIIIFLGIMRWNPFIFIVIAAGILIVQMLFLWWSERLFGTPLRLPRKTT